MRLQTKHRSAPISRVTASSPTGRRRALLIAAAAILAGIVLFVPVALITDRSSFCTTCHSMNPFYRAWQQGPHKDVACIRCHVDPGLPNRFAHKFVAIQEVYVQLFGQVRFPNYNASIPDARCLGCHGKIASQSSGTGANFSHRMHLNRGVSCAQCHADAGHKVAFSALQQAGLLNSANAPAGATFVGEQRDTKAKASALPGHKPVTCSRCHDQANLRCSFCHATPAKHFGTDCRLCHQPSKPFASFAHPLSGEHSYTSRPCVKCHPNGYQTAYCTCHKGHPPKGD